MTTFTISTSDAVVGAERTEYHAIVTNEVTFRAERRAEIAIGRPSGFVVVGTPGS